MKYSDKISKNLNDSQNLLKVANYGCQSQATANTLESALNSDPAARTVRKQASSTLLTRSLRKLQEII